MRSDSCMLPFFGLVMLAIALPAHAEFSFIAKSTCDPQAATVRIEQVWTEEPETYRAEAGSEIMPMDNLVKYVTKSSDDYRMKVRDWKLVCTLNGTRYEIEVSPWNWNNHVGGMCGAGSPDIELTVRRDGQVLVSHLVFSGYCDNTWNEKLNIYAVTFSETRKAATFTANNGVLRKPVAIEQGYADLGVLTRAKVWTSLLEALPAPLSATAAEALPRCATQAFLEDGANRRAIVSGAIDGRVPLYRHHPHACIGAEDSGQCQGHAYLIPGDSVQLGVECSGFTQVRYQTKHGPTEGWVADPSLSIQ